MLPPAKQFVVSANISKTSYAEVVSLAGNGRRACSESQRAVPLYLRHIRSWNYFRKRRSVVCGDSELR